MPTAPTTSRASWSRPGRHPPTPWTAPDPPARPLLLNRDPPPIIRSIGPHGGSAAVRRGLPEATGTNGGRMPRRYLFTSESVTEGHPDKLADRISDAVLDEILATDPYGRVACETFVTTGVVLVAGEISTSTYVDVPTIVRSEVKSVGYVSDKIGFDGETCGVITSIQEQSPDIAQGVDTAFELRSGGTAGDDFDRVGAGDQGMMLGYA